MIELTLLCAVAVFAVLAVQRTQWGARLKLYVTISIILALSTLVYAIYWTSIAIYGLAIVPEIRQALAEFGPSIMFGLITGYLLFRGTVAQEPQLTFLATAGICVVLPVTLAIVPSFNRYVQEIKTPWLEAKLVADARPTTAPTGLHRFLDRSAGSSLDVKAYAFLKDLLRIDQQIEELVSSAPDGTAGSNVKAPEKNSAGISSGDQNNLMMDTNLWLTRILEPVLLCVWNLQRSSDRDEALIRRSLRSLAYAGSNLFYQASVDISNDLDDSEMATQRYLLNADNFKKALANVVVTLNACVDDSSSRNLLTATFIEESRTNSEKAILSKAISMPSYNTIDEIMQLSFVYKIARTPYPYVLLSRLLRFTENDEFGLSFLEKIDIRVSSHSSVHSVFAERADLSLLLNRNGWEEDLIIAIDQLEAIIEQLSDHVMPDFNGCRDAKGDGKEELYAITMYELTHMRNRFAFETIYRSLDNPENVADDIFNRAGIYALINYESIDRLTELECAIVKRKRIGDVRFEFTLDAVLGDTYAVFLLARSIRQNQRSSEVLRRAKEILERSLIAAQRLRNSSEVRSAIRQHLSVIDLMQ